MSFKNLSLFEAKLDLAKKLNVKKQAKYNFICSYHGIKILFKSDNIEFINSLKAMIPREWEANESDYEVHFQSCANFDFTNEQWSDEESQDCIDYQENIGIQRDFVASEHLGRVGVITDLTIMDGFYNFLRWFLSRKLIDKGVLILHSSCVLDEKGLAHFFLGHSGAGKTTLTTLSKPRRILGDDMNLISIIDGEVYAQAGAIGGVYSSDIGYAKRVKVGSINWLIQSEENSREKLSQSMAYTKILASVANIFWETLPKERIDKITSIVDESASLIPSYCLHFKKSNSFWSLIE